MKKIQRLIAVFALFLGLTAAFAFKAKEKLNFTYGISGETTTSWIVQEDVTNQDEGFDYTCGTARTLPCTVTSNSTVVSNKIPKSGSAIVTAAKTFVP